MDWEGLLVLMMVKRVGYVMSNSIQLYLSLGGGELDSTL